MRTKLGIYFGLIPALALASGCDGDNDDDQPELYVVSVVPGDQQTNVPTGTSIVLRFSVPPDPASFGGNQIILVDQSNSQQPISIAVDPVNTEFITITPVTPLAPNVTYGVAIRELVTDYLNKPIQPPFSMRFSTGAAISNIPGFPPFTLPPGPPPPPGAPGTFTPSGQSNNRMDSHRATRLLDGSVMTCGGLRDNVVIRDAEVYDPVTGTWRVVDPNGKQGLNFRRFMHTATRLNNGQVLITGGTDGTVVHDTAEIYDPSTDSFTVLAGRLTVPRQRHAAVKMDDGNVLIMGGVGNGLYNSMEVYDVTNGSFTNVNSIMTIGRDLPTAVRQPDGRILAVGGRTPAVLFGFVIATVNSGETFSPTPGTGGTSGSIQPCGNRMSTTRWWHRMSEFGAGPASGLILVSGGTSNNPWAISLINSEVYDYLDFNGAGGFRPVAQSMTVARWDHESNFLSNDKVVSNDGRGILVTGGFPTTGTAVQTNRTEIFDPFGNGQNLSAPYRGVDQSGVWARTQTQTGVLTNIPTPPLFCGLAAHEATQLLNQTVILTGGTDCLPPLSQSLTWIYTP